MKPILLTCLETPLRTFRSYAHRLQRAGARSEDASRLLPARDPRPDTPFPLHPMKYTLLVLALTAGQVFAQSVIGLSGNLTLVPAPVVSPTPPNRILLGASGDFGWIGQHVEDDGLFFSLPASGVSGAVVVNNPTTGSLFAMTEYEYGHTLTAKNGSSQLEVHVWDNAPVNPNYRAVATFVADQSFEELQIRNPTDTNSIQLRYPAEGLDPYITTQFADTNLQISPKGTLYLNPTGNLTLDPGGDINAIGDVAVSGELNVKGASLNTGIDATTGDVDVNVGVGRSGSGNAFIDLIGDTTYTDYGTRLRRHSSGANADTSLDHRGTGTIQLNAPDGGKIALNAPTRIGSAGTDMSKVRVGTATLTAGSVTVSDAAIAANSRIFVGQLTPGGTVGAPFVSAKVASTSFTIASTSGSDTSVVSYLIIDP